MQLVALSTNLQQGHVYIAWQYVSSSLHSL